MMSLSARDAVFKTVIKCCFQRCEISDLPGGIDSPYEESTESQTLRPSKNDLISVCLLLPEVL